MWEVPAWQPVHSLCEPWGVQQSPSPCQGPAATLVIQVNQVLQGLSIAVFV